MDPSSDTTGGRACTECGRRTDCGFRYFRPGALAVCDGCYPNRPLPSIGDPRWAAAHEPLVTHHV